MRPIRGLEVTHLGNRKQTRGNLLLELLCVRSNVAHDVTRIGRPSTLRASPHSSCGILEANRFNSNLNAIVVMELAQPGEAHSEQIRLSKMLAHPERSSVSIFLEHVPGVGWGESNCQRCCSIRDAWISVLRSEDESPERHRRN